MKPHTESLAQWDEAPVSIDGIVAAAIRLVKLKQERRRRMQSTTFTREYAEKWLEPLHQRIVKAECDLDEAVQALARKI